MEGQGGWTWWRMKEDGGMGRVDLVDEGERRDGEGGLGRG